MKLPTLLSLLITTFIYFLPINCHANSFSQEQLNRVANTLKVRYQVYDNIDQTICDKSLAQIKCYQAELQLTFSEPMPAFEWQMYFSQVTPIKWEGSDDFDIQHINGDLHKLISVNNIQSEKTYRIPVKAMFSSVSKSDVMPNYFITAKGLNPAIIASTIEQHDEISGLSYLPHAGTFEKPQQNRRSDNDAVPIATPEVEFERNKKINSQAELKEVARIIPKAKSSVYSGNWVSAALGLALPQANNTSEEVAFDWLVQSGIPNNSAGLAVNIALDPQQLIDAEGYQLSITEEAIVVSSSSEAGIFYGLMSLAQLYDKKHARFPVSKINDGPEFGFRGVHIDVARNFHSKAFILSLIEQMAAFKLNKLHLHMADDEGWRLEIEGLPELTDIGAFRCFDLTEQTCLLPQLGSGPERSNSVNGYFTKQDYIQIVKYADLRNIEIIPSMDMPGHSRAAVKSMLARYQRLMKDGQIEEANKYLLTDLQNESRYSSIQHYNDNTINPCMDSTYTFIGKVLGEIATYHDQAKVPLKRYHIGADETAGAWHRSPICQAFIKNNLQGVDSVEDLGPYFISRIAKMLDNKGIVAGAWSDGVKALLDDKDIPKMQVNVWETLYGHGHNEAHKFTNAEWQSILSIPDVLYFDFPYAAHASEPGYYWASRAIDSYKLFQFMPQNLPAHAQLWLDNYGAPYMATDSVPLAENTKITGIQAQLWSETVRSDNRAEFMLYPRLFAFSERAWHNPNWVPPYQQGVNYKYSGNEFNKAAVSNDWQNYASHLVKRVLPALEKRKVFFRIPPPGAKRIKNMLHANSLFPGLTIYYRQLHGGWKLYTQPVSVTGPIELASGLDGFTRRSRIVKLP